MLTNGKNFVSHKEGKIDLGLNVMMLFNDFFPLNFFTVQKLHQFQVSNFQFYVLIFRLLFELLQHVTPT